MKTKQKLSQSPAGEKELIKPFREKASGSSSIGTNDWELYQKPQEFDGFPSSITSTI